MRLEQVRRDFVANVSHELRTPLTVVHGYLDLIEPEQMQEYEPILRELRNQSRRMTQIVEDLLTLSRLEAQNEIPSERVGMRPLIEALRREAMALSLGQHTVSGRDQRHARPARIDQGSAQRVLESRQQRGALHAGGRTHHAALGKRCATADVCR